jgi:hypothetical protein
MKAGKFLIFVMAAMIALFCVGTANAKKKVRTKRHSVTQQRLNEQQTQIETLKQDIAALKESKEKKEEKPTSGYDKGFFIGSRDGNFLLKLRLFTQIYYEYQNLEDAADVNSFGIRRARLLLSGNVFDPNLTYMLMAEMATTYLSTTTTSSTAYTLVDSGGDTSNFTVTNSSTDTNDQNFRLLYLWAQYRFADEFQIRVGEFIPPTEFFFRASNLILLQNFPMIAVAEPFTPNFQTGMDILGTIAKKVDYEAFAVNGSNLDRVNANKSFRTGLALTFNIMGKPGLGVSDVDYSEKPQLALTFSGAYERADYSLAVANVGHGDTAIRGQTNAVLRYRGFSFVPEFIVFYDRTRHNRSYGVEGQMGYFIIPKHFEVAGQAGMLKYTGPKNDLYELTGGLNYYFYGHQMKIQADYSYLISQRPGDLKNDQRVRVGTQIGFF